MVRTALPFSLGCLLGLTACGSDGPINHLDVAQISVEGGVGCAPATASNTVPRAYVQDGAQVRLGLRFADPRTGEPAADLAGRSLEVFRGAPESQQPDGAPIASGVINGAGLGVIDWRPAARSAELGQHDDELLIVHPDGYDPSPPVNAEILRPYETGGNILCAYAANAQGERVGSVDNNTDITLRAHTADLPPDYALSFDTAHGSAQAGPLDAQGEGQGTLQIGLPDSDFPREGRVETAIVARVAPTGDPDDARERSFRVMVEE